VSIIYWYLDSVLAVNLPQVQVLLFIVYILPQIFYTLMHPYNLYFSAFLIPLPTKTYQTKKMAKDDVEMADASAPAAAEAKKSAAKKGGPKKALPAPRFEIKKWNVSLCCLCCVYYV